MFPVSQHPYGSEITMAQTTHCPPTARKSPQLLRGRPGWIALLLALAITGFAAAERGGVSLDGPKLETGSIPGEDWHGNVRRSGPAH